MVFEGCKDSRTVRTIVYEIGVGIVCLDIRVLLLVLLGVNVYGSDSHVNTRYHDGQYSG